MTLSQEEITLAQRSYEESLRQERVRRNEVQESGVRIDWQEPTTQGVTVHASEQDFDSQVATFMSEYPHTDYADAAEQVAKLHEDAFYDYRGAQL